MIVPSMVMATQPSEVWAFLVGVGPSTWASDIPMTRKNQQRLIQWRSGRTDRRCVG